ncbi:MAG TPA: hypothetical protein VJO13_20405 [Ktedonobacterales bacterium]|nr:hypothetical protein [Ktedonobacterales bacterium]
MDHKAPRRRMTWFGKEHPGTVGGFWQRTPQSGGEPDASTASPTRGQAGVKTKGSLWPTLPKWPPLHDSQGEAARDETSVAPVESQQTEPQLAPPWEQPASNQHEHARPPFVARRFLLASRRQQLGLAAILGTVVLTALLGLIVLRAILPSQSLSTGQGTPTGGRAVNVVASPTAAAPTPTSSPTAASARTTPTPPFTVAFTCASGAIGGRGIVCVHTKPDAMVSLTVRYCDGSYAGGKDLHGSAHTDASGNYTWRWNVSASCAGTATATVTAKSSGQTVIQSTTFTIAR